jgi:hypothetical protein
VRCTNLRLRKVPRDEPGYKDWFEGPFCCRAVTLDPNLNDFNRRLAGAVRALFPDNVRAEQSPEGKLCFRGPKPRTQALCEHAAVNLDSEVLAALEFATPLLRDLMIRRLIGRLEAQLRAQYDRMVPGDRPLSITGTLDMLSEG